MLLGLIMLMALIVIGTVAMLRYTKGVGPLRAFEQTQLPAMPGAQGLLYRLQEKGTHFHTLKPSFFPKVDEKGNIHVPASWNHQVTAGRVACTLYLWQQSLLIKENPAYAKERKLTRYRAVIIPFFTALILFAAYGTGVVSMFFALSVSLACWAFFIFAAVPAYFKENNSTDRAESALRQAGLWPVQQADAQAIRRCLDAMVWCHMPGFRSIWPH